MARILTHYDPKPIPMRQFDWCAFRDGYEGPTVYSDGEIECRGDPVGYGRTEAEAIADLHDEEEFAAS